jgi:hypothetical protein
MSLSVHHSFNIHLATYLKSADLAILLHHFDFWIDKNARANRNFHEGAYWTYDTLDDLANTFPYYSRQQIQRMIDKLVEMKVLIKGNFNKSKFDRTCWYTYNKEFIAIYRNRYMENSESVNGNSGIDTPIPDTKTHIHIPSIKTKAKRQQISPDPKGEDVSDETSFSSEDLSLSKKLISKICEANVAFESVNASVIALEVHKLIKSKKGIRHEDIEKSLEFCLNSSFWAGQIAKKKNFMALLRVKFAEIYGAMKAEASRASKPKVDHNKNIARSGKNPMDKAVTYEV